MRHKLTTISNLLLYLTLLIYTINLINLPHYVESQIRPDMPQGSRFPPGAKFPMGAGIPIQVLAAKFPGGKIPPALMAKFPTGKIPPLLAAKFGIKIPGIKLMPPGMKRPGMPGAPGLPGGGPPGTMAGAPGGPKMPLARPPISITIGGDPAGNRTQFAGNQTMAGPGGDPSGNLVCKTSLVRCQQRVGRLAALNVTQSRRIKMLEIRNINCMANLTMAEYDFNNLLTSALTCNPNLQNNVPTMAISQVPMTAQLENGEINFEDQQLQLEIEKFNNWILLETAQNSYQMQVAFNDIVMALSNDVKFKTELNANNTVKLEECYEDINNLLAPGNDPTKLRSQLLQTQQAMRDRHKQAGRAKAKLDRLYETCQDNLQQLNNNYISQSNACNKMRMEFKGREQELLKQIEQLKTLSSSENNQPAEEGKTTINLGGGGGLNININNKLPYGGAQPGNAGLISSIVSSNKEASNESSLPQSDVNSLAKKLSEVQQLLYYCETNRTKLENFLADRVDTVSVNGEQEPDPEAEKKLQELVLKIQEQEQTLLQSAQENGVLIKEVEKLRDTVELLNNDKGMGDDQLANTQESLSDAQNKLDQAELAKKNFQEQLTERNEEILNIKEACFEDKQHLRAQIALNVERMSKLNRTIHVQSNQLDDVQTFELEIQKAYAEVDTCNLELNDLKSDNEKMLKQLKELSPLAKEVKEARQQIQVIEFKYEHEKNMRTQKHNKLELAVAEIEKLNQTVFEKTEDLENLMKQLNEKDLEFHACKVELDTKISEIGMVQLDMFNQQADLMNYKSEFMAKQKEINDLKRDFEEMKENNLKIHAAMQKITKEKLEYETNFNDIETEYKQAKSIKMVQEVKIKELQAEIDTLANEYKGAKSIRMVQEVKIKELEKEIGQLEEQIALRGKSSNVQISNLENTKKMQQQMLKEFEMTVDKQQKKIQAMSTELNIEKSNNELANNKIQTLESQVKEYSSSQMELQSETSVQALKIKELESRIQNTVMEKTKMITVFIFEVDQIAHSERHDIAIVPQ